MELTLKSLTEAKAFTARPVAKEITWNGNTFTAYVRPLSYQTAVGDIAAVGGADPLACRIAASICDEQGRQVFKVVDITGEVVLPADWKDGDPIPESRGALDPDLTNKLLIAIGEVQSVKKAKP